jgi:pyruvate kinase
VVEVGEKGAKVRVDHGGVIKSNKGVNIPGSEFDLPAMTTQDISDIKFGCSLDIDLIAASFVRSAEHVLAIKELLEEAGKPDINVIAKIENRQGVQNIDSIVQVADGVMVARGDLGVEMPLTQVPRLQKMMIRKCYLGGKPAVTATQMLESMINNPRPTRAEASDVANAIYDSTSAAMLSGETAVGRYPIESVRVMCALIEETERDFNYYEFSKQGTVRVYPDVPSSVTLACVKTAYSANAKAIFAFTTSGSTARLLSRLRPEMPIIAMTPNPKVYHQLALSWGVVPILCTDATNIEDAYKRISDFALENGYVNYGDLVVITAGTPFGRSGTTNMIIVDSIGDVLVRGNSGYGPKISAKISLITSPDHIKDYEVKGKIIVINNCNPSYLPLLKSARGVILQNHVENIEAEWYLKKIAEENNLSVVFRAEGAAHVLREEQLVTLDPEAAIVSKGVI